MQLLFLLKYYCDITFYVSHNFYGMPNLTQVPTVVMSRLLQTGTFHKYLNL